MLPFICLQCVVQCLEERFKQSGRGTKGTMSPATHYTGVRAYVARSPLCTTTPFFRARFK